MFRSLFLVFVASASGFQLTPAAPRTLSAPRCTSPTAIDLPELPSLSLPKLPVPEAIADIFAYKPQPPKGNDNKFDKDGRLVKGPAVTLSIQSQITKDNTKTKKD